MGHLPAGDNVAVTFLLLKDDYNLCEALLPSEDFNLVLNVDSELGLGSGVTWDGWG